MSTGALFVCFVGACAVSSAPPSLPATLEAAQPLPRSAVPVGLASGQFHTIPVRVNGDALTVGILDTGIGLALISQELCERIGCELEGEFTGRRMSGQAITIPLTTLASLDVGGVVQNDVPAAVIDIDGFFPEPQIEAFVGLPFFENVPFTIEEGQLILESPETLAEREAHGSSIPVRLQRHGPALDIFIPITVGGAPAEALMDTGSRTIILDMRYAETLGVDLSGPEVRTHEGHDETGQSYMRYYTSLDDVAFAGTPSQRRQGLEVMFQEIIYDALVGKEFLASFTLTYDLARQRVIVAEPAPALSR
ncbi:MAG: aspartyl protease family protein [Polyangiales bacterium]